MRTLSGEARRRPQGCEESVGLAMSRYRRFPFSRNWRAIGSSCDRNRNPAERLRLGGIRDLFEERIVVLDLQLPIECFRNAT